MSTIILPPVAPRPKPPVRPTMHPMPKTPGNKGTEVLMVNGPGGDGPPDPPAPIEDLAVVTPTLMSDLNGYYVGQDIDGFTATFKGGTPGSVTYRYRWQTRATSGDSWTNSSWTTYSNQQTTATLTLVGTGEMRLQSQASDSNPDASTKTKSSYSPTQTVADPPTLGNVTVKVDDVLYDPATSDPVEVTNPQTVQISVTRDGSPNAAYNWSVRSGDADLSPIGSDCLVDIKTPAPGTLQVQCDITNQYASDSPKSFRVFFVVVSSSSDEPEENRDIEVPALATWNPLNPGLPDSMELKVGELNVLDQEIESNYNVVYEWEVHDPYGLEGTGPLPLTLANLQLMYPEMGWVEAIAGPQCHLKCTSLPTVPEGASPSNRFHLMFTAYPKHPQAIDAPYSSSYTAVTWVNT